MGDWPEPAMDPNDFLALPVVFVTKYGWPGRIRKDNESSFLALPFHTPIIVG